MRSECKEAETIVFNSATLENFITHVLLAKGFVEQDAIYVGDALIWANLHGVDSHGIRLLPAYLQRIDAGLINTRPKIEIVNESKNVALISGDNGLGQVVATKAMNYCIERINGDNNFMAVGVFDSNHFGAAGYYAALSAKAQNVGFATSNGSAVMVPFGGISPYFGANPLAIAVPTGQEYSIVVDMATSLISRAKIRGLAGKGENLPKNCAIDKTGNPTLSPQEALEGALLPLAGPKGYGLALICEILSGVLTGSAFGLDSGSIDDLSKEQSIGHFFASLSIKSMCPFPEYTSRIQDMIQDLHAITPTENATAVLIPGEKEQQIKKERINNGIPIPKQLCSDLKQIEKSLDLPTILDESVQFSE